MTKLSRIMIALGIIILISALQPSPTFARRDEMRGHPGSVCFNMCKEPWRGCFRRMCLSIPGFRSAPGQYREQAAELAKTNCRSEWKQSVACAAKCHDAVADTRKVASLAAPACYAADSIPDLR
jgi:hypothetical protein